MKGYRMVLLVNAALFLLFGLLAYLYAAALQPDAGCATDACAQQKATIESIHRAAPFLLATGLLLGLLGALLGRRQAPQP